MLEVDAISLAARIQAGATGPRLEEQLREHGLTLRHFPQSFEYSTLGGWIATRAGGHFATLYTHIDDLVESVRAITPRGDWESRRLPGSGAGPEPRPDADRLGGDPRRDHRGLGAGPGAARRGSSLPRSPSTTSPPGPAAVREISQSGLNPSNCRLLDPAESETPRAGPPGKALLVLGFESAHHPVEDADGDRARGGPRRTAASRRGHAATVEPPGPEARREAPAPSAQADDPVDAWRHAFLCAPYLRDTFVACGVLSDTFETAITWDRFADFHAEVMETARRAVAEACGGPAEGPGSPRDQLPLHPRLPGRPGALLHGARARPGAAARSSSGTRSRRRSRRR